MSIAPEIQGFKCDRDKFGLLIEDLASPWGPGRVGRFGNVADGAAEGSEFARTKAMIAAPLGVAVGGRVRGDGWTGQDGQQQAVQESWRKSEWRFVLQCFPK